MEGAFLLTALLTGGVDGPDGLGEDVRGGSLRGADDVGVDAERDSWVRVT